MLQIRSILDKPLKKSSGDLFFFKIQNCIFLPEKSPFSRLFKETCIYDSPIFSVKILPELILLSDNLLSSKCILLILFVYVKINTAFPRKRFWSLLW